MKRILTIAAAMLAACLTARADLLAEYWARMGSVESAAITFTIVTNLSVYSGPTVTAPLLGATDVYWTRSTDGARTNSKSPSGSFFSDTNATYTLGCSDYSKITALSFYLGGSSVGKQTIKTFVPDWTRFTGLESICFRGQAYPYDVSSWVLPMSIKSLAGAFQQSYWTNYPSNFASLTNLTDISEMCGGGGVASASRNTLPSLPPNITNMAGAFQYIYTGKVDPLYFTNSVKCINNYNMFNKGGMDYCTYPVISNMTQLISIGLITTESKVTGNYPVVYTLTNATTLPFENNHNLSGDPPVFSNLTRLVSLRAAFRAHVAGGKMASFPYLLTLTNVTDLYYAFYRQHIATGDLPSIVTLDRLTTLEGTFTENYKATGNSCTITNQPRLASLVSTFQSCTNLTGIGDVMNITGACSFVQAWYGCSGILDAGATVFSSLPNVNSLEGSWWGCTQCKNFPAITAITNATTIRHAWAQCRAFTNTPDSLFGDYSGLTKLTDSRGAFSNCVAMSGVGSNFVNAVKSASYTVGTASTNSSYRTFYNCTNLSDWATIPDEYK